MKAISIWQPHASLIIGGIKRYETRSWPAPHSLVGQRIAIHAAKKTDDLKELTEYISEDDDGGPVDPVWEAFRHALKGMGFVNSMEMPRGCLLGTAILSASLPTEIIAAPGAFGDFSPGRFAWHLRDIRALPEPIPFRGMQGFFEVPDDLLLKG